MSKPLREEVVSLCKLLAGLTGNPENGFVPQARELVTLSSRLHKAAEDDCNRGLSDMEKAHADKCLVRARDVFKSCLPVPDRYRVERKTDPRAGAGIALHGPGIRGNSWGGDEAGWYVMVPDHALRRRGPGRRGRPRECLAAHEAVRTVSTVRMGVQVGSRGYHPHAVPSVRVGAGLLPRRRSV